MNEYHDYKVCSFIYKQISNKKILNIEHDAHYFKDKTTGKYVILDTPDSHAKDVLGYEFRERYSEHCFAYKTRTILTAAQREPKGKRKPISLKDIDKIKEKEPVKFSEIEKEVEEDMPKEIVDTGAQPLLQDKIKFLSIDESKELFRGNPKARTKYAWYENKTTFEQIVSLEFYKNDDYSSEDIAWLGTRFKYLYYAFEKNGAQVASLIPDEPTKAKTKSTQTKVKTDKVSQSSEKMLNGNIVESKEYLPLAICRRLWINQIPPSEEVSWYIEGKGAKSRIFCVENKSIEQTETIKFACLAYRKDNFPGLDNMVTGITEEQQIKHLVNGYLYERRNTGV